MGIIDKLRAYRFCLPAAHSPTYHNLCHYLQQQHWQETTSNWLAHINEDHFLFDSAAAECLEFKNKLAQLVTYYCEEVMPTTFCINDENWQPILSDVAHQFYTVDLKTVDQIDDLIWIFKPATLNNGQHIKIFQTLSDIERHYLSSNRMGGEHVLQRYLTKPHLLKGPTSGHKYSIRMFVVISNYAGAYLYPEGYFNVALQPYLHNDFTELACHLTNEHLNHDTLNVTQIPTRQYDLFKPFYPKIKSIVTATIDGLKQLHPNAFVCKKDRSLAIFGFDFMVDTNERVWLLEVNHGPCFPIDAGHPLQQKLYAPFWQAFITSFIIPIAARTQVEHIRYQLFEAV